MRWSSTLYAPRNFNPRTPERGATPRLKAASTSDCISIHAPLSGVRHRKSGGCIYLPGISIHAPLSGVRPCSLSRLVVNLRISIHAPLSGVRLGHREAGGEVQKAISIHAPLSGVRRRHVLQQHGRQDFNPRTPERGATTDSSKTTGSCTHFNPRTPERGATHDILRIRVKAVISIHAPLSGVRRKQISYDVFSRFYFNPRTPERGATGDDD